MFKKRNSVSFSGWSINLPFSLPIDDLFGGFLRCGDSLLQVHPSLQFQPRRPWCRGWAIFGVIVCTFAAVYLILLLGTSHSSTVCGARSLDPLCGISAEKLQTVAPLNFLVVGDWGQDGLYNQTIVAKQVSLVVFLSWYAFSKVETSDH